MLDWLTSISDHDIPNGWATVFAAIAGSIVLVGGPAIGVLFHRQTKRLKRIGDDAKVARDQVANDHLDPDGEPINMRVEQDERHHELVSKLDSVISTLDTHTKDIGGIRHDIRTLHDTDTELSRQQNRDREAANKRIDLMVEHTIPRDELGAVTKKDDAP